MKRAWATKRAMASATREEWDRESNGFGGKSDGDKGGGQSTVTRAMVMMTARMWVM